MKRILLSAACALCATIAHADGALRLGMTPEPYMPFTSVDAGGQWTGLEADLTRAVCAKIPEGCEFKQMAWDGLIPSLKENKVDFIIGAFSVTDERKQVVDFSTPYYTEGTSFVGMKDDDVEPKLIDAADGSGKVLSEEGIESGIIGVQSSSVQANYVAAYLPNVEAKAYDTADNSVADLIAGRVDYLLVPDMFIDGFLKSDDGAEFEVKLEVPTNPKLGQGVAYAVRKGDAATLDKVNKALAEMQADGSLQKMVDKWIFGRE
ncbi:transporter substrate-binding domain-containing protein [Paracoccus sp. CPCC 101403]|uniref:Transporter substrate-binding domain-containing protein n=2 Tax=Paracoccus broussonetiae TaxID=3075834 RepID=A0ABU3EA60_9RHOB|nr:transporter substrate-binding domain-containing protein [Paracoccus sp. CPCC 101403]MDT1061030.1 transporter substrate-binding domain-containing protein [Paracoccus sp. CPCC 101403]